MVRGCPFHEWLGVEVVSLDQTGVVIRMPWRAEFVSGPDRGNAHGACSLRSSISRRITPSQRGSGVACRQSTCASTTIARRCQVPLVARAAVIKFGGTLATAEARIFDERDELIASGRALFFTRAAPDTKERKA
jgi:uncharacterized protein (TIGR00369 family)